jgi:multiple sugar transport system permease protein
MAITPLLPPAPVSEQRGQPQPRRSFQSRKEEIAALGFLSPNLLGLLGFTLVPIVFSIVMSFMTWPVIGSPEPAGLANYARLLTGDPVFWTALRNTLYYVVAYVALNLVVSMGLAVWLSTDIKFKGFYRVIFFLPVVTPVVANAVIWKLIYTPEQGILAWAWTAATGSASPNWLGSYAWAMPAVIVMSVWQGFGYNMLIFIAGIEGVPDSVLEAAKVDGTNAWQRYWRITLPIIGPSVFFATVMTIISSFQVFAQPFILTSGGPGTSTTTLVFYLYQKGFLGYEMGYASSIAWFLFMMIMTITFIQFKLQKKWVHYE